MCSRDVGRCVSRSGKTIATAGVDCIFVAEQAHPFCILLIKIATNYNGDVSIG